MSIPMSLINSRNKVGQLQSLEVPQRWLGCCQRRSPWQLTTHWEWSLRKSLIQLRLLPRNLYLLSLWEASNVTPCQSLAEVHHNAINLSVGWNHCVKVMVKVSELVVTRQALPEAMLFRGDDTPLLQMSVDLIHHAVLKRLRANTGQKLGSSWKLCVWIPS